MKEHANPEVYFTESKSFRNFLKWCDEKEIIFGKLKKLISGGEGKLLDIGAGEGILVEKLVPYFKEVVAVEPSEELIKNIKNKKIKIINKEFEKTEIKEKFDLITAIHSIQYLRDLENQLKKIYSLLNENGKLIIVHNKTKGNFCEFLDKFWDKVSKTHYEESFEHILTRKLDNSGFDIEKAVEKAELKIPSVDETMKMLDFFFDIPLENIDEKIKSEIKAYLKKEFNNEVVFQIPQLFLICSKK